MLESQPLKLLSATTLILVKMNKTDSRQCLEKLKEYFERDQNIHQVILSGSFATGGQTPGSDMVRFRKRESDLKEKERVVVDKPVEESGNMTNPSFAF